MAVQRTGVYFVSWSAASPPNITQAVFFHVNGVSVSRILLQCGDFNGIDYVESITFDAVICW
jgi:hypothetical protein